MENALEYLLTKFIKKFKFLTPKISSDKILKPQLSNKVALEEKMYIFAM